MIRLTQRKQLHSSPRKASCRQDFGWSRCLRSQSMNHDPPPSTPATPLVAPKSILAARLWVESTDLQGGTAVSTRRLLLKMFVFPKRSSASSPFRPCPPRHRHPLCRTSQRSVPPWQSRILAWTRPPFRRCTKIEEKTSCMTWAGEGLKKNSRFYLFQLVLVHILVFIKSCSALMIQNRHCQ